MNVVARPRSTLLVALLAFAASLLPLAAAAAYYHYRTNEIAKEVDTLEKQLVELNQRLDPIGNLDQLRGQMLARKQIVDVLQYPQRGLDAAIRLVTQLPAGVQLLWLDVDEKRLSLQARCTDAAATAALLRQVGDAGFSDPAIASRSADEAAGAEQVTLEAGVDPARFAAPAQAREVTP
jgi:Tfp pilus assembly protein PilN